MTDAANQTTQFTYNGFGQIKTIQDAQNHFTTANYDTIGYLKDFTGQNPAHSVLGYKDETRFGERNNNVIDVEYMVRAALGIGGRRKYHGRSIVTP
ncbi:MAG: hypothetical protein QOH88_3127 [Verrucomicrobiota bacterium]